jgi:hypothetical protein
MRKRKYEALENYHRTSTMPGFDSEQLSIGKDERGSPPPKKSKRPRTGLVHAYTENAMCLTTQQRTEYGQFGQRCRCESKE